MAVYNTEANGDMHGALLSLGLGDIVDVLGFPHGGTHIWNPWEDETHAQAVHPEQYYGFKVEKTEEGTAFVLRGLFDGGPAWEARAYAIADNPTPGALTADASWRMEFIEDGRGVFNVAVWTGTTLEVEILEECDGCSERVPLLGSYEVFLEGDEPERCHYCPECANLAARNFNGNTRGIRPIHVPKPQRVKVLAMVFTAVLREWLSAEEWAAVVQRNAMDDDPNVCHSHDFCDANEAMIEAHQIAFGCDFPEGWADSEEYTSFLNAAWETARKMWAV